MYLKKTHVNILCWVHTCGRLFHIPPYPISHTLLAFTSLRNPFSPTSELTMSSRLNTSKQDMTEAYLYTAFPSTYSCFSSYTLTTGRTYWKKPRPHGIRQGLSTSAPANGTSAPTCKHMRAPSWKWLLPTTLLDKLSQKMWCVAETSLLYQISLKLHNHEQINTCYFWSHKCLRCLDTQRCITGTLQSHSEACFLLLGLGIVPNGVLQTASRHFCLQSCCYRE